MNNTLRQCGRCGRCEYAGEAQIDMLPQPDGQPCGGVFSLTTWAIQEQARQVALTRSLYAGVVASAKKNT